MKSGVVHDGQRNGRSGPRPARQQGDSGRPTPIAMHLKGGGGGIREPSPFYVNLVQEGEEQRRTR